MKLLDQKVIDSLNFRIEQEELSSRLYRAMSVWLDFMGYMGAAKLWKKYADEEQEHANAFYEYLLSLDIKPETPALEKPTCEFESLPEIIKLSYEHEVKVTEQIQELAATCMGVKDFMTLELAQKYLKEQVEEINKMVTFMDKIEAFGDSKEALRLLDNEMLTLV